MTEPTTPHAESTPAESTPKKRKPDWVVRTVIIAAVVGVGIWVWDDFVKDRVIPRRLGVVKEKMIFRGGQVHPALIEDVLRTRGIDLVIDMTSLQDDDPAQQAELAAVEKLGIEHLRLPLGGDGTGQMQRYVEALVAINQTVEKREQVLVHCSAGSQRTGGVIALYRLLFENWPRDKIIAEMKRYDWREEDQALVEYLDAHLPEIAAALVEAGVLKAEDLPATFPKFADPEQAE